jgi:hypothetical protein
MLLFLFISILDNLCFFSNRNLLVLANLVKMLLGLFKLCFCKVLAFLELLFNLSNALLHSLFSCFRTFEHALQLRDTGWFFKYKLTLLWDFVCFSSVLDFFTSFNLLKSDVLQVNILLLRLIDKLLKDIGTLVRAGLVESSIDIIFFLHPFKLLSQAIN